MVAINGSIKLSVIIPFHIIHIHCLKECVESLAAQTLARPEYEVILVNAEGDTNVRSIVKDISANVGGSFNFQYIETKKGGRALARNVGVKTAGGDLFLFFASDFVATSQLLEHHVRLHEEDRDYRTVGIGPALFSSHLQITPFMEWLEESGNLYGASFSPSKTTIPADFFYGANTSIKRQFLTVSGEFNEALPYHAVDDYEMGRRLLEHGMRTRYLRTALAYHDHAYPMAERRSDMKQSGESSAIAESKNPGLASRDKFHNAIRQPEAFTQLRANWYRTKYLLFRRRDDLWNYFDALMIQSWVEGYMTVARRG